MYLIRNKKLNNYMFIYFLLFISVLLNAYICSVYSNDFKSTLTLTIKDNDRIDFLLELDYVKALLHETIFIIFPFKIDQISYSPNNVLCALDYHQEKSIVVISLFLNYNHIEITGKADNVIKKYQGLNDWRILELNFNYAKSDDKINSIANKNNSLSIFHNIKIIMSPFINQELISDNPSSFKINNKERFYILEDIIDNHKVLKIIYPISEFGLIDISEIITLLVPSLVLLVVNKQIKNFKIFGIGISIVAFIIFLILSVINLVFYSRGNLPINKYLKFLIISFGYMLVFLTITLIGKEYKEGERERDIKSLLEDLIRDNFRICIYRKDPIFFNIVFLVIQPMKFLFSFNTTICSVLLFLIIIIASSNVSLSLI